MSNRDGSTPIALECDYEVNCTPLYKALEVAEDEIDYATILGFIETGNWTDDFGEEMIEGGPTAAEQVKTWVTLFHGADKGKIKWSRLPLHVAIMTGAPSQIIASLVKAYPEALRCRDNKLMLPLHLALQYEASDDVVVFLLMQFPDAVNMLAKNNLTPINCALKANDKVRGILLDIFTEQSVTKVKNDIAREKLLLQSELVAVKAQSSSTEKDLENTLNKLRASEKRALELDAEISELRSNIHNFERYTRKLEQDAIALASEWDEKMGKLQSDHLLAEIETQRKLDEYKAALDEKDSAEQKARAEESLLKAELETVHQLVSKIDADTDVYVLRKEIEDLKAYREGRIRSEIDTALKELKSELENLIPAMKLSDEGAKERMKEEVKTLMNVLDRLQKSQNTAKTLEDFRSIRCEINDMRAVLKDHAESKRSKLEIAVLKKSLEMELRNFSGKSKEIITALKKMLAKHNLKSLETKTPKELFDIKADFENLKKEIKEKEFASKVKKEVDDVKHYIDKLATNNVSQTNNPFVTIMKKVENLQSRMADNPSTTEIVGIKIENESLKAKLKLMEEASHLLSDIDSLKQTVETSILESRGESKRDLLQVKNSLNQLTGKNIETIDSNEEIAKIKVKLSTLRDEVQQIEKISKTQLELNILKEKMEHEIKMTNDKVVEDLEAMKKVIVALNSDHLESQRLKSMVEVEILKANEKAESEINNLKKSIEAIDIKTLQSKNEMAWDELHKEMENLKYQLKMKEIEQNTVRLNEQTDHRATDYDSLKADIEILKQQMQLQAEINASTNPKSMKKIQLHNKDDSKRTKEKSIKQLLSLMYVNTLSEHRKVHDDEALMVIVEDQVVDSESVGTILPPRYNHSKQRDALPNISENEKDDDCDSVCNTKNSSALDLQQRFVSRKNNKVIGRSESFSVHSFGYNDGSLRQMIFEMDAANKYKQNNITVPTTTSTNEFNMVHSRLSSKTTVDAGNNNSVSTSASATQLITAGNGDHDDTREQPDSTTRVSSHSKTRRLTLPKLKLKPFLVDLRKSSSSINSKFRSNNNGNNDDSEDIVEVAQKGKTTMAGSTTTTTDMKKGYLFERILSKPMVSTSGVEIECPLNE